MNSSGGCASRRHPNYGQPGSGLFRCLLDSDRQHAELNLANFGFNRLEFMWHIDLNLSLPWLVSSFTPAHAVGSIAITF